MSTGYEGLGGTGLSLCRRLLRLRQTHPLLLTAALRNRKSTISLTPPLQVASCSLHELVDTFLEEDTAPNGISNFVFILKRELTSALRVMR
jgi:hypothetical protein